MARVERLMKLMDVLRRLPPPVTAESLACETGVSPRQLYRDIATLRAGGAVIDGSAGVGYVLTEDPTLPPQSFSQLEIEALMLAVSGLEQLGDPILSVAGKTAMARIVGTLPNAQAQQAMHAALYVWRPTDERPPVTVDKALLWRACWEEFSVIIQYRDLQDKQTEREILPLGMSYGTQTLFLLAFCTLRNDHRTFHVHRIEKLERGSRSFRPNRVSLLREFSQRRSKRDA